MIPQLRDWHGKYEKDGLTIVGVHAPEFTWERPYAKVVQATKELKVAYPVVQDNDFAIWKRFGNLYTLSEHVAPPLTGQKVRQYLKRELASLVLFRPRAS